MTLLEQFKAGKIAVKADNFYDQNKVIDSLLFEGLMWVNTCQEVNSHSSYFYYYINGGIASTNNKHHLTSKNYKIISAAEFLGESEEEIHSITLPKGSLTEVISVKEEEDGRITAMLKKETLEEKKLRLDKHNNYIGMCIANITTKFDYYYKIREIKKELERELQEVIEKLEELSPQD